MNKKTAFTFLGAAVLASVPATGHTAELLVNGSFESPALQTNGDHVGTGPGSSWTIAGGGQANLTRGVITTGTVTGGQTSNLPLDPYDGYAGGSQQSLDISATGTLTQTFTALYNAPATIKFDIGGRDTVESDNTTPPSGSTWTLFNAAGTQIAASPVTLKPALNQWATNTFTTANLVAGADYRFVVNLDNPEHVDGLSVTQVPEPTTAAAVGLGLGLLGWLGYKRRRRS